MAIYIEYRALFTEYVAIYIAYMALFIKSRALLKYRLASLSMNSNSPPSKSVPKLLRYKSAWTHMNVACHTHASVMSHVTHMNESQHTYQ